MKTKTLLHIEDEDFAIDWVRRIVGERFGGSCSLDLIRTEREFLLQKPSIEKMVPSGIILDLILPWEDGVVGRDSILFAEPRGDVYEAGIRILRDLRESAALRNVPLLIYSTTERTRIAWPSDLPDPKFISKNAPDLKLLNWISEKVLSRNSPTNG